MRPTPPLSAVREPASRDSPRVRPSLMRDKKTVASSPDAQAELRSIERDTALHLCAFDHYLTTGVYQGAAATLRVPPPRRAITTFSNYAVVDVITLDNAFHELARIDERQSQMVERWNCDSSEDWARTNYLRCLMSRPSL